MWQTDEQHRAEWLGWVVRDRQDWAYITYVYGSQGRWAVPFRAGRSSQNVRPALKWLACPNCHGRAVRIGLVTYHHLFLRCDDCGEPLSLPERRRSARKLSKIP